MLEDWIVLGLAEEGFLGPKIKIYFSSKMKTIE
jgi:hypothetical protein